MMGFLSEFAAKSPKVEVLFNSVVVPLVCFDKKSKSFDGGVFYCSGDFCELSRQVKAGYYNSPDYDVEKKQPKINLNGKYLYGGMLQNRHFGHFLIESLSRLWFINDLDGLDGVIFYLRSPERPVANFITEFFSLIFPGLEFIFIKETAVVEKLYVPEQLCMPRQGYILGHKAFGEIFNMPRLSSKCVPSKLYVSRSKLSKDEGRFLGEESIEKALEKEGYVVIHPQEMTLLDQIRYYRFCEKIIFADGSAFHLYSLFATKSQSVFVIWRRARHAIFDFQLSSFTGRKVLGAPVVVGFYKELGKKNNSSRQKSILDFDLLRDQLIESGFISGVDWIAPAKSEVLSEVERLYSALNKNYEYVGV